MKFIVNDRTIKADGETIISYNLDYMAEFEFDPEWSDKIITARFVLTNGNYYDVILEDNKCQIPLFKKGLVALGVYTDEFTSTYVTLSVHSSIKDLGNNEVIPPSEDVYQQIIRMIEEGKIKGDPGEPGKDGSDYIITESDYQAIADRVPQPDLTDYVRNTDYATATKGGVVRIHDYYGLALSSSNIMYGKPSPYNEYINKDNYLVISKGTLENVLNERLAESEWEKVFDDEIDATTSIPISKKFDKIVIAFWCTESESSGSSGGLSFKKNGNILSQCNLSSAFTLNNHRVYYFENNGGCIFNSHAFASSANIFNASWWSAASIASLSIRSILPLDKWEEFDEVRFAHNNAKAFKGRLTVWVR